VTDTTDKETNERTDGRTDGRMHVQLCGRLRLRAAVLLQACEDVVECSMALT